MAGNYTELSDPGAAALPFAHFGSGADLILLDDVHCRGTEKRLLDCSYFSQSDCDHSEDASVRCSARGMQQCMIVMN